MGARALPRPLDPPPAAEELELESAAPTMARAKLRRFVDAEGIDGAVRKTGIPRATLLALRLGRRDDPKLSQILALERHAGIGLHDWATPIPALRSPSSQK